MRYFEILVVVILLVIIGLVLTHEEKHDPTTTPRDVSNMVKGNTLQPASRDSLQRTVSGQSLQPAPQMTIEQFHSINN